MSKPLLGFQLADVTGHNIQGDDNDPTGLASFEVMTPDFAVHFMSSKPSIRYLLMPIYVGDIEEPVIVHTFNG